MLDNKDKDLVPPEGSMRMCYVKFRMSGFPGDKHAVLFPNDMTLDKNAVRLVTDALRWELPNLMIYPSSSAYVPRRLWTSDELKHEGLAKLCEKYDEKEERDLRECLVHKLKAITDAILSAAEQTGSWTLHDGTPGSADMLASACLRGSSLQTRCVNFINAVHDEKNCISKKESWDMFKTLYKESKWLSKDAVAGFAKPVELNSPMFEAIKDFDLQSDWKGHMAKDPDQSGDRAIISQWMMPDAALYFIKIHQDHVKYRDSVFDMKDEGPPSQGNDATVSCSSGIELSTLGIFGLVVIGGNTLRAKKMILHSLSCGAPTVVIGHTGGLANSFAVLLKALNKVMKGKQKTIDAVRFNPHKDKMNSASPTVEENLAMVNPRSLLKYIKAKDCRGDAYKEDSVDEVLKVADIANIIDMAIQRPNYFLQTVSVVDPLEDTPETCLNELSACFSSTCTGALELGASAAQTDVVLEAWDIHRELDRKARSLRQGATFIAYLCTLASWIAIVVSILIEKLTQCLEEIEEPPFICGFPSNHAALAKSVHTLEWSIVFVPILGGLFATLGSYFLFLEKWGAVKLKSAEIVREIYLFRSNEGSYSINQDQQPDEEGGEDEPISASAMKKKVRQSFMNAITEIYSSVMLGELRGDTITDNSPRLKETDVREYVMRTLYGDTKPRSLCGWPRFCCCCGRRDNGSISTEPANSESYALLCSAAAANHSQDPEQGGNGDKDEVGDQDEHAVEEWIGDKDDFVSLISAEDYYNTRVESLTKLYTSNAPALNNQTHFVNVLIFFLSFVASMLGAFSHSSWIPMVVGFSSMLSTLFAYHGTRGELIATNSALAVLRTMRVEWMGASNIERRTPFFKKNLIMSVENQVLAVTQGIVGSISTGTKKSKGDDKGGEDAKKKKKKKDNDGQKSGEKKS